MNRSQLLAIRIREIFINGTWVANTNYNQELSNISYETAHFKYNELNSIAILAQHIHYYLHGVLAVLQGAPLEIKDKFSFDFPILHIEDDWQMFISKFLQDAETFAYKVEQLTDLQLDSVFVHEKYGTYQRNIDALIEHSYYHLGQIVLIKKIALTQ